MTLLHQADSMAIGSLELGILVLIAIFLFGANRIPQLARSMGQAKGEFQQGLREASEIAAIEDMDRGGFTEEVASEQE
ncbi:MAG: twin-arginine translocase TatA/TatE family subunit [Euryarchaeota archaeon]|nr:twin-arginine translocase TatA/TatE family subunit [Euryarchaeota archaeon]